MIRAIIFLNKNLENGEIYKYDVDLSLVQSQVKYWADLKECPTLDITPGKNLEEKDGQTQLLCYVSLIRACNKVL